MTLPRDPHLLEPLGRVTGAAVRLQHEVRDALDFLGGAPSDAPFGRSLRLVVHHLEEQLKASPSASEHAALLRWCQRVGGPAAEKRDHVTVAITYTADDGGQAMMNAETRQRIEVTDLLEIAAQLTSAARDLSQILILARRS